MAAVADCASWARAHGHPVHAVALAAAMHTVLGLDEDREPVTPAANWADTRSSDVADRLRADSESARLHQATGTPVHTQSVMVKLAWLTGSDAAGAAGAPDAGDADVGAVEKVATWCSLKDYVFACLTDVLVADHSMASGSGLQEMTTLNWYEPALRVAGISAADLPELHAPSETFPLARNVADMTGLPSGLPVVLGGGDGPLANLGVGAVKPGMAALSLGTSGALRVMHDRPRVDDQCRTFCYALDEGLWALGGAISNGGVLGQWAADTFGVAIDELLDEAEAVAPGADGLIALPYLLGERAPWWQAGLTGSLIGLRNAHGRAEITRALIEGASQQLALVRDAVTSTGAEVAQIRAAGGSFRSNVWSQVLAAALNRDLMLTDGGSGVGAGLLGWRALGGFGSLSEAADTTEVERTVRPDPEAATVMARRRPLAERAFRLIGELAEE